MKRTFSLKSIRRGLFVGLFGLPILYAILVLASTPARAEIEYDDPSCPSGWQQVSCNSSDCYLGAPGTGICCDVSYGYWCPDTGQTMFHDRIECGAQC